MSTSTIKVGFQIKGVFWDPGYNPNNPWDVNSPNAVQFDEHGYWYTAGESDGRQMTGSKIAYVPDGFQADYQNGYDDGVHKYKFFNYF